MLGKNLSKKLVQFYVDRYQEMAGYTKPTNSVPFDEMVKHLVKISDEVYGGYAFVHDPFGGKADDALRSELTKLSNEEGEYYAEQLQEKFGRCKPSELAEFLGIKIKRPDIPDGGGRVLFAEFEELSEIRVYQDAIKKGYEAIEKYKLQDIFQEVDFEEILIAHEIYHYVEMMNAEEIHSRNYKLQLWKLGPYKHTTHMNCLGEIAAMSFAKKLCGIDFSPYLLDVFFVYLYNSDAGYSLYEEIANIESKMVGELEGVIENTECIDNAE